MRELPILFSTPMVQAILENRKKMTRRTYRLEKVNEAPDTWELEKISQVKGDDRSYLMAEFKGVLGDGDWITAFAQYNIGDCIWVRETFFDARKFKSAPLFVDGQDFYYKADKDVFIGDHKWKSSLFMPKEATRIWLEVTGVRCERLQNINHEDAIAEGILPLNMSAAQLVESGQKYFDYSKPKQFFVDGLDPFWSFNSLWCSINGGDSWELNPWVWVYEFKRIEKP